MAQAATAEKLKRRRQFVNRRDALIATLSAAAIVPALRAAAATQAIATPSVTGVDPAQYPKAWEVQRSTLVVDGLDPSAINEKYLEMLKAGGVNCWRRGCSQGARRELAVRVRESVGSLT
ncbi:MAG TPA: hypothetical protein VGQ22_24905 [Steroidobacteraceae bacterium]|jgi:hypothetical protein|nr:hypothetical protein [Steroidobacteraceae bacterium]